VLRKKKRWWWARNTAGQTGFIPSNFVTPVPPDQPAVPAQESAQGVQEGAQAEDTGAADPVVLPALVPLTSAAASEQKGLGAGPGRLVRTLHHFEKRKTDHLSFAKGHEEARSHSSLVLHIILS
jgi:hypothetical protein